MAQNSCPLRCLKRSGLNSSRVWITRIEAVECEGGDADHVRHQAGLRFRARAELDDVLPRASGTSQVKFSGRQVCANQFHVRMTRTPNSLLRVIWRFLSGVGGNLNHLNPLSARYEETGSSSRSHSTHVCSFDRTLRPRLSSNSTKPSANLRTMVMKFCLEGFAI